MTDLELVLTMLAEATTTEISKKEDADKTEKSIRKMSRQEREQTIQKLTAQMRQAAQLLEFEHAAYLRDKIQKLRDEK